MTERTNRKEQRRITEEGGWTILYGDLINEWDVITGLASIPIGAAGVWASDQIQAQLRKFQQSLSDVSEVVVNQATDYLIQRLQNKHPGERDFHGLGIKAGMVTYKRWMEFPFGLKTDLPNNHQPYIGLRITKPLPPTGAVSETPPFGFEPVYQGGDLGSGIGGFDLKSSADRAFAFDYDHSGKLDHIALYRPGTGTMWILKNTSGVFQWVYAEGDPGGGIGGFDLKSTDDRAFAFDYDHSGKLDHIALYRPGTGTMWILKNTSGVFQPVYAEGAPGGGIGGFDLKSTDDRAFAFDYDHSGKLDHIALYRPGTGTMWILKNTSGVFQWVYAEGDPGGGIGGFDLKSTDDRAFAFDYDHSGKLDHIALYRPGTGTMWILKNTSGVFQPVYAEGAPGGGIGGFDLKSTDDRAFAFDYDHSGKLDHIALYRPGTGTMWILKNTSGVFQPVYAEGAPGGGIGGFDLKSNADQEFAFDFDHSGKLDYLVLYRPGTGTMWILRRI